MPNSSEPQVQGLTRLPGYWSIAEIAIAIEKSQQSVQNAITGYRSTSGYWIPPCLGAWKAGRSWCVPHENAIRYIAAQVPLEEALDRVRQFNQGYQVYSLQIA